MDYTKEIDIERKRVLNIIISVILIGLALNYIASYIFVSFNKFNFQILIVFIVILVLFIVLLLLELFSKKSFILGIKALILFDKHDELVRVPEYDFSEGVYRYLNALFVENADIKKEWKHSKIVLMGDKNKKINRNLILKDVIEYYFLEKLSTHLTDYYNNKEKLEKSLREYSRDDIKSILDTNICLNTFSRPMKERKLFVKEKSTKRTIVQGPVIMHLGEAVSSQSKGAIYQKFDMVLYKGSRIIRENNGWISIKTKHVDFSFVVNITGFNALIPTDFTKYYLNKRRFLHLNAFEAEINIKVKVNPLYLVTGNDIEYYEWIDLFAKNIKTEISFEAFLESIGWKIAPTIISILKK